MRYIKKQQLLDILKSMEDSCGYISAQSKHFEKLDMADTVEMLSACQEAACTIGNTIEEVGKTSEKTVALLEDYCELLYRQTLMFDNEKEFKRLSKKINSQLIKIRSSINADLPEDKKEIVFMPYKASMWDSLESVWMAANEDERCNAVVVPIPYFDRTERGTLAEMHYEGGNFPDYVPITDWQTYDLSVIRPDVIYIHNPYDGNNLVTSVHPAFYSHELKKYTDMLVYIPYYSTTGGMAESQRSLSAYYSADYIVIQTESFRRFFDERLSDSKFLPFGSPKLDRVINMCKNPPEMPDEWKKKTEGKRIYFFNTSISGFLMNSEMFLKKMRYVFDAFKGRDDAVILWRPHPLLETTVKSLRTELIAEYNKLKEEFITEDIGIFDTTPDITPSVTWSDAYIGDTGTSVISLFQMAAKPLFLLNNFMITEPELCDYTASAFIQELPFYKLQSYKIAMGNKLFASAVNGDEIAYKHVCDLPHGKAYGAFNAVIEADNVQYIVPESVQSILKYENGAVTDIRLKRSGESMMFSFRTAHYDNDRYIVLIPNSYSDIVRYDIKTGEIAYLGAMPDEVYSDVPGIGNHRIGGTALCGGVLYAASSGSGFMYALNITDGTVKTYDTGLAGGCAYIVRDDESDGKTLWLLPERGTAVVSFDTLTEKLRYYEVSVDGFECHHNLSDYICDLLPFGNVIFKDEFLYLMPYWGNKIIRLNSVNGTADEWTAPMEIPYTYKNGYHVTNYKTFAVKNTFHDEIDMTDYDCLLYAVCSGKMYKVNMTDKRYKEVKIKFDAEDIRAHAIGFAYMSEQLQYACYESCYNSLKNFLDGDITGNRYSREEQMIYLNRINASMDGGCGRRVHEYVTYNEARR